MQQGNVTTKIGVSGKSQSHPASRERADGREPGTARIAVIGTFGNANLGDDSLLAGFLRWTRDNAPATEVIALTSRPEHVTHLFDIAALDYDGRPARPRPALLGESGSTVDGAVSIARESSRTLRGLKSTLKGALPRLWPALHSVRQVVAAGLHAFTSFPRQLRVARSLDGFLVLGGGQIFDHWGGPTGHPLTVFLWALACRIASVPIVVLSLGGRPLHHRASRWLWRRALEAADYVSFRDPDTIELMRGHGYTKRAARAPDLAFGLRVEGRPARRVPRVIGVSPMAYRRPGIDPEASDSHYWDYVGTLATVCERLHEAGYEVVMFPSQTRSDTIAIGDVLSRLRPTTRRNIGVRDVTGVDDLLDCIAATDAMLATRFHGVLLSLVSARPVVSISYQARKNDRLLEPFGLGQFAVAAEGLKADTLWHAVRQLLEHCDAVQDTIVATLPGLCDAVDEQYRRVFSERGWLRAKRDGPV
jgi:polysaccharide pyruvyl transferase WcaK-like protein